MSSVLDAVRQKLRCLNCRDEDRLPTSPEPLDAMLVRLRAFEERHATCQPQPVPAPVRVRTGPYGAALTRDHDGHWWKWTPTARASDTYTIQAISRQQAQAELRQLITALAHSNDTDDAVSVAGAQVALWGELQGEGPQ